MGIIKHNQGAEFNWQQGLMEASTDTLFNAFYRNIKISENRVGIIILGTGCLIQAMVGK